MNKTKDSDLNEVDADFLRSVMDRYVGGPAGVALRVTLSNGVVFVVRNLSEVEHDRPESEHDTVGAWSGEILETENLDSKEARLFPDGSGVDFSGSEIVELEDEETGEIVFTRSRRNL